MILLLKSSVEDDSSNKSGGQDWKSISDDSVFVITPLQFEWMNIEVLANKIRNPDCYTGALFTSQRSVESFQRALDHLAITTASDQNYMDSWKKNKLCYVVGHGTSNKVEADLGWEKDKILGRDSGNAKALAPLIISDADDSTKLLYPCGQLESMSKYFPSTESRILDKLITYRTCPSDEIESRLAALPEALDVVVFFSPTGVKYALDHIIKTKKVKAMIAIGPTTTIALNKAIAELDAPDLKIDLFESEAPSPSGVKKILDRISKTSVNQA